MSKILTIFASYDKYNQVPDYVVYYLKELKKVSDIIFVADNELSSEELQKIKTLTIHQICHRHNEYDFGSYKRGYQYALKNNLFAKYDDLILCNDSCFGPFYPLADIIAKMNAKDCDFWGMFMHLANNNCKKHIQSYFVYLKKEVAVSDVFSSFISSVAHQDCKEDIIAKYEVGLSQILMQSGYKCKGLFNDKYNTPHLKQALKLIQNGFPFLKKSLFIRKYFYNNAYCRTIYQWKDVIKSVCPQYNTKTAEKYLIKHISAKEYYSYLNSLRFYYLLNWKRFLFQKKITKSGKMLIKICKIPLPIPYFRKS